MKQDNVIMRTIIDLPDEQLRGLELWCRRERISRAEAVRRAIGSALSTQSTSPREEPFGASAHKKVDSRRLVESLRSEWEK